MAQMKKTFLSLAFGGLFFMVPGLLIFMLIMKAIHLLTPIGSKISTFFELETILGEIAVITICIVLILTICFISGSFIQKGFFKKWSNRFEEQLFILFPTVQTMRYRLVGDQEMVINEFWHAVIIAEDDDVYNIAFITDSTDKFYTLYIPDAPKIDAGEVRYVAKDKLTFYPITTKQAMSSLYTFGKGLDIETIIKENQKNRLE
ncbi:hypothetical protein ACFS5J_11585 [Flavobacterium chuncheonense]|uniref:DUF502 domain-containing protein n=2 Tax=Flavobacterium chuncheonense TaxID=2026653 RepID=A0ABW5YNJ8_9FLAO